MHCCHFIRDITLHYITLHYVTSRYITLRYVPSHITGNIILSFWFHNWHNAELFLTVPS